MEMKILKHNLEKKDEEWVENQTLGALIKLVGMIRLVHYKNELNA